MLPASTGQRKQRDATRGRQDGRTVEIQRLIGRSLRGVVDFEALGERTVYLDCDVLQADGGTRCASITGAYVALSLACERLRAEGLLERSPLTGSLAAVSCGMVGGAAAAGPRLLRGLHGRGRRQRRDDRRRRPGRGAGDGRAHAALARAPRRAAGAGGGRASSSCAQRRSRRSRGGRRGGRRRRLVKLLLATHNEHKRREFARLLPDDGDGEPWRLQTLPEAVELPPEDWRDVRRERAGQGARGGCGDRAAEHRR